MKTTLNERNQTPIVPLPRLPIGLSFMAFILIGANDGAFGVLIPSLRTYYDVDKATISLLFLPLAIGYLIGAFNTGLLLEKLGQRLFLMLGATSFLGSALVLSSMPSFIVILIMLLPLGFGVAVIDAGLNAYIAGLPRNAALLNYLHAFYGAGALIGPIIASSILAIGWGWNRVYIVWVGLSLMALIGFSLFFSNTSAQKPEAKAEGNILVGTLKLRAVWIVGLFLAFYVGTEISLGSWSYSFLTEERHGAALLSGWIVSGYWFGLMLGRLLLARVAQRVGSKRLIEGCLVGVGVGVLLVWLVPAPATSAFGLWLTGFSLGPIFPSAIALMSGLVPERILPSAIGFLASMGCIGGALLPALAGNLAQHIGLWSLLPYVIALTIVLLLLWLILQRRPQRSILDTKAAS